MHKLPVSPGRTQEYSLNRRIVFVLTTLSWGGAESQVISLAVALSSRGWTPTVVSLLDTVPRGSTLRAHGIPVKTLGMRRGLPDIRGIWRLRNILAEARPDVVHAHMVHANLLARITRLVTSMPVLVTTAHNVNEGGRFRRILYRATDRLADLTTNVSKAAVRSSISSGAVPPTRIRYMPNGIDMLEFYPNDKARARTRSELGIEERFVWLAVGSLQQQKDYPNMISAFTRVASHSANPILLIVGKGPLREEVQAQIMQAGLSDSIRMLGTRQDVPALMNAADAYLMSSAWEGLPMVLLEAAASGLPMVSTDVGGNEEVVVTGKTGVLVPPKDSEALSSAINIMMDLEPQARRTVGACAASHARQKFALEGVVDRWEEIYAELLGPPG